jgi:hypothetical protein
VVSDELMAAVAPAGIVVAVRDPASDELDVVASHGVVTDDAKDVTLGAAGLLRLAFDGPRDWEPDERDFLTAVAGQTGLALERARLHQRTADVAVAESSPAAARAIEATTLFPTKCDRVSHLGQEASGVLGAKTTIVASSSRGSEDALAMASSIARTVAAAPVPLRATAARTPAIPNGLP